MVSCAIITFLTISSGRLTSEVTPPDTFFSEDDGLFCGGDVLFGVECYFCGAISDLYVLFACGAFLVGTGGALGGANSLG